MRTCAILLMGGSGSRFGNETPKQFCSLRGKEIYCYALETMLASKLFDEIVLVSHSDWLDLPHARVIQGGKTRQESSYLGLKSFTNRPDIVLIHDAVRPFVTERILRENVEGALQYGAINTCIASADTIVHAPKGQFLHSIPNRSEYMRGQTPQTFRMDWIVEAHEQALKEGIVNATDDCQLVMRLGKSVGIVLGDEKNMKITTAMDLIIAEQICISV